MILKAVFMETMVILTTLFIFSFIQRTNRREGLFETSSIDDFLALLRRNELMDLNKYLGSLDEH